MKIYTIIGGVNGSGKSSLTGLLKAERTDLGTIIDADKITAAVGSSYEGGKIAVRKIDECLRMGVSFTQETTLSGVKTERTARRAREGGYFIRLYYVGLNTPEESLKRIQNRVEKGGHNIPREDVERRFKGRFDALMRILPYCDEAAFFDNENGFIEVAEYRNGEVLTLGNNSSSWLNELKECIRNVERGVVDLGESR